VKSADYFWTMTEWQTNRTDRMPPRW